MKKLLFLLLPCVLSAQVGAIRLKWEPYDLSENWNASSFAIVDSVSGLEVKTFSVVSQEFSQSWAMFHINCDSSAQVYKYYMVAKTVGGVPSEPSNTVTVTNPLYAEEYSISGPESPSLLSAESISPSRVIVAILKMQNGTDDFALYLTGATKLVYSFTLSAGNGNIDVLTGEPSLGDNNDGVSQRSITVTRLRKAWEGNFGGNYSPDINLNSITGSSFESTWTWDGITFRKIFVLKE